MVYLEFREQIFFSEVCIQVYIWLGETLHEDRDWIGRLHCH